MNITVTGQILGDETLVLYLAVLARFRQSLEVRDDRVRSSLSVSSLASLTSLASSFNCLNQGPIFTPDLHTGFRSNINCSVHMQIQVVSSRRTSVTPRRAIPGRRGGIPRPVDPNPKYADSIAPTWSEWRHVPCWWT